MKRSTWPYIVPLHSHRAPLPICALSPAVNCGLLLKLMLTDGGETLALKVMPLARECAHPNLLTLSESSVIAITA